MWRTLAAVALYSSLNTAPALADEPPASPQPLIRGEITLNAQPGAVLRTLLDTARVPQWAANVESVTVLAFRPPNQYLVRTRLALPFPLADRELISRSIHGQLGRHSYLNVVAAPDSAPPDPERPRIERAAVCWQATVLGDGQLQLRYLSYAEIAPWLPEWLTSAAALDAVELTLSQLPAAVAAHQHGEPVAMPALQFSELNPLCQQLATENP
ncbi:MAG: hypothetical protein II007_11565 [Gammaproteobacteria bacterium]|nr:hypothetical protein [Gammaproteobacteria bacterium]